MADIDLQKEIEETLKNLAALNMDGSDLYLDQEEDDDELKKGYKLP